MQGLIDLNAAAEEKVKTCVIVHENTTPFGSYMAGLMKDGLEPAGFEVLETLPHPTPNKDFNNIALKIRELNPDVVIPRITTTRASSSCARCSASGFRRR